MTDAVMRVTLGPKAVHNPGLWKEIKGIKIYILAVAVRRVARGPVAVCNPGHCQQIKGIKRMNVFNL